jgi:serine/threonine protein kinase
VPHVPPPVHTQAIGAKLHDDRYEVLEFLGGGTYGEVYRVWDDNLKSEVALKLLKPRAGIPLDWAEAQTLQRLHSDFLLEVLNAAVIPGVDLRYFTTPIAAGGDLSKATGPHGQPVHQALRWCQQAATGLARMHDGGLLHRDVKPLNVFLDGQGNALLGDVGIAAAMDAAGTAAPDGTQHTCAPEVFAGGRCSVRGDVYSLGVTAFYALTGTWPRDGADKNEIAQNAMAGRGPKLSDLAPHVPRQAILVVNKAIALNPAARYPTAGALAADLGRAARVVSREWQRTDIHPNHHLCIEGTVTSSRCAVNACLVPNGRHLDLIVAEHSGRRQKRNERYGLTAGQALSAMRAFAAKG